MSKKDLELAISVSELELSILWRERPRWRERGEIKLWRHKVQWLLGELRQLRDELAEYHAWHKRREEALMRGFKFITVCI